MNFEIPNVRDGEYTSFDGTKTFKAKIYESDEGE